jgi:hypothetical protein
VWKRSYGCATKAPPDERGGNRHAQPKATAPHSYSTQSIPCWTQRECLLGVGTGPCSRFERSPLSAHFQCTLAVPSVRFAPREIRNPVYPRDFGTENPAERDGTNIGAKWDAAEQRTRSVVCLPPCQAGWGPRRRFRSRGMVGAKSFSAGKKRKQPSGFGFSKSC